MARPKTTIRRLPERSVSETEAIYKILDEGFVCHVGYLIENRPVVIPTLYARDRDRIILHGSTTSGISRAVRNNSPLSIAVTLIDGLVVARSAFHSSANYRSVVIHGHGKILNGAEQQDALNRTLDHLLPGRSTDVRTGPPGDDPADLESDIWAGVIPLNLVPGVPLAGEFVKPSTNLPDYLDRTGVRYLMNASRGTRSKPEMTATARCGVGFSWL